MENQKVLQKKHPAQSVPKSIIINIVYALCAAAVSSGAVLGELAPFGASFAAAVPKRRLFPSLVGAGFGYILLNVQNSFRYLAAIVAIGALRWLVSDLDRVNRSPLVAPLAAFLPVFATGVALLFVSTSTLSSFADCVIEAVLAGAAAYFMSVSVRLAEEKRGLSAYSQQESACLVMTGCVLILAFGSLSYESISLGRIIAITVILLCARYGSVTGGGISGIATGSVFSIASREQGFVCGGFAFGGLMAGLFAPLGKLGCAVSFVVANGIMSLAFGEIASMSGALTESVVGSVIFMLLPKEMGNIVSPIFSNESNISVSESLRRNIVMRLDFASKAVYNVRNDVNKVSQRLNEICAPTFETVCSEVEADVCSGCGLKSYCFEHRKGVTLDDFYRLEQLLEANGKVTEAEVGRTFVKNCCKKGEIAHSMNRRFREYLSALEAQRRVSELRGVVAGQFSGVSDILKDMSEEFKNTMRSDTEAAARITNSLSAIGAIPIECVCLVTDGGRLRVELVLSDKSNTRLSKGDIMREVSKCCGRRFDLPLIAKEGGRIRATLSEMPVYDVEIGSDQHIANNGKLCGDCIDYFNDGFGKTYAIVCDGMGTGGRAAVDGNMAASVMGRLLRSGLSADSSLQIVNSALMVKSEDESLSTLDVASVDLFTGRVTVRKAGAPMTFVKKSGRVSRREMPSLPAGILNGIKFSTDSFKLTTGDMVVMVSDGVLTGDDRWLESLIKSWDKGSTQELARAVVEEAVRRRSGGYDDDITALAVRIVDNEY